MIRTWNFLKGLLAFILFDLKLYVDMQWVGHYLVNWQTFPQHKSEHWWIQVEKYLWRIQVNGFNRGILYFSPKIPLVNLGELLHVSRRLVESKRATSKIDPSMKMSFCFRSLHLRKNYHVKCCFQIAFLRPSSCTEWIVLQENDPVPWLNPEAPGTYHSPAAPLFLILPIYLLTTLEKKKKKRPVVTAVLLNWS